ncbi:MAG: ATP-dependent Clp protease proteolytic subunit [Kiritimatiellae bacterium]|nr:ATP-dependent Clp protease proteolytic subunit [Kiritimatiellia bacterium]
MSRRQTGGWWSVVWLLAAVTVFAIAAEPEQKAEADRKAADGEAVEAGQKQPAEDPELQALKTEKEKLALENELRAQRLAKELAAATDEKKRLTAEMELLDARRKKELAALQEEKERLELDYQLMLQRQKLALAKLEEEKNRLAMDQALRQARLQDKLAQLEMQKTELEMQNALEAQKLQQETAAIKAEKERLSLENQKQSVLLDKLELDQRAEKMDLLREMEKLKFEQAKMEFDKKKIAHERLGSEEALAKTRLEIQLHETEGSWQEKARREMAYRAEPVEDGCLHITDRRVVLTGPIVGGSAKYVSDQIDFLNNQSTTRPIFLIIDDCPGGSVMEGYRIIKAMESSEAPVYVVVKSFAASMAAAIVAMADHSYAYRDAVVVHHQMYSRVSGNQTQLSEVLEFMKEWEQRIHGPVAKKMGLTLEEFVKQMYAHSSDGDWREFGDAAVTQKWVGGVVAEIREHGLLVKPEEVSPRGLFIHFGAEKRDEHGNRYVELPRLGPCDFYFLYDPDNYYR